jgi:ribosomal protein L11 methylase PrmA
MLNEIILILVVLLITYFLGIFRGAPFVPTTSDVVEKMVRAAAIKPDEKIVDLGSGDGRLVIAAARAGGEAHGFEINPLLVWWSRYKIKKAGLRDRAFVHQKNFWFQDFSQYDVVMLFGITKIMAKLETKLKSELKPGSRVVSNIFRFPKWESTKDGSVYVYKR